MSRSFVSFSVHCELNMCASTKVRQPDSTATDPHGHRPHIAAYHIGISSSKGLKIYLYPSLRFSHSEPPEKLVEGGSS